MDFYGFYTGSEFHAYEYLGAHVIDGGVAFRVFAPAAKAISVIGEFNQWQDTPMQQLYDGGLCGCGTRAAKAGQMCK